MAPATVASQLRSVQEEIGALRDALGNVQNRLADLTRQAIDERTSLLTQIEELQLENEQLQNDGRWLRTQNQDLEHKSEVKMPELDNALEARNAAVRRLRRCQRVVRDLLDERLEDQVQEGPAAVTTGSKKLPDEVVERMAREVLGDATPTGTTTSSSLRTADQRRRGRQSGRPVKLPTISQQGATGDHSGGNTSLSAVTQNTTDDVPAAAVIPQPVEAETERDRSKDANETTAIVGQAGPSGQETGSSQTEYTVVSGKPKFLPRPWGPTKWDELPVQLKSAGIDAEFKLDE
ncbi:hypothetical protein BDN72DRAFT_409628 [Pluteus cervinus]|uniref:Uncharacterized protein n=1 Tax=Pluteus cervinus TaxID=181527 RepID=A0ACD3B1Z7_9AGAR|nr:hypothetical protein BDN72DRAFT_409628 [Pluteus cervinus]